MSYLHDALNMIRTFPVPSTGDKKLTSVVLKQLRNNINDLTILISEYINKFIKYYKRENEVTPVFFSFGKRLIVFDVSHFCQTNLYSIYIGQLFESVINNEFRFTELTNSIYYLEFSDKFITELQTNIKSLYPYSDYDLTVISMVFNRKQIPTDTIETIKNYIN